MAEVVSTIMNEACNQQGYDIGHKTLLVYLSQFFWDSMHSEERLAFKETNNFLKFFLEFSK